jgi:hypothetical protein
MFYSYRYSHTPQSAFLTPNLHSSENKTRVQFGVDLTIVKSTAPCYVVDRYQAILEPSMTKWKPLGPY